MDVAKMAPFPSKKTLPTEVKAAVLAAPASSEPIGVELPETARGDAVDAGTKSEVLTPSQPNEPTTSPLPLQERACRLGATERTAPSKAMPERDNALNLVIDILLNKFLTNPERSKNYKFVNYKK